MQRHTLSIVTAFALALAPFAHAADDEKFTDLFDGKTLAGWTQRGGKAIYKVEDGVIVGSSVPNTPNSFLCTEKAYGDFILEYEFKCDDALNSGVQIRSNSLPEFKKGQVHGYQVEIDPNSPNRMWAGGIYDEGRRGWLYPGLRGGDAKQFTEQGKKLYKFGDWNKVRVEARGDRIRTWLNGEPRADMIDALTLEGFIGLQVHGVGGKTDTLTNRWRNIRIIDLGKRSWTPIWNGKDFTGWSPTKGGQWKIETIDGQPTIVGTSAASDPNHGIMLTDRKYGDFTIRLKYRIMKGNSGLYFRVDKVNDPVNVHGFQAEMDENNDSGGLYETGGRAWVVQPKAEDVKKYFKPHEWNEMIVSAQGGRITVFVNGTMTAQLNDDPGRREGHIGLQMHGGQDMHVMFRDIEVLSDAIK